MTCLTGSVALHLELFHTRTIGPSHPFPNNKPGLILLSILPALRRAELIAQFPRLPMDNDFDSVSWQNDPDSDISRPNTAEASQPDETKYEAKSSGKRKVGHGSAQAGADADPVDLAGIGDGSLDCTVDTPLKENEGTKDAYMSYLVTTNVRFCRVEYRAHRPIYESSID